MFYIFTAREESRHTLTLLYESCYLCEVIWHPKEKFQKKYLIIDCSKMSQNGLQATFSSYVYLVLLVCFSHSFFLSFKKSISKLTVCLNVYKIKFLFVHAHQHPALQLMVLYFSSLPMSVFEVLFGQFVVFQTLPTDVVEIYDGPSKDSNLLSSIYGSHSGKNN